MTREQALAPFDGKELRTFQGRGGKTYTYVEDETVMDRLDLWPGSGNWAVHVEPISVADGIVKVALWYRLDKEWLYHEDFGYQNGTDGEGLKEAVSDGIRRCGRFLGIGRDLYRKSTYETAPARQERPQTPAPAPVRARPHIVDTDLTAPDDEDNPFDDPLDTTPVVRPDETRCPWHPNREPKQGKYGLFCSGQGGNGPLNAKGYCEWKGAA